VNAIDLYGEFVSESFSVYRVDGGASLPASTAPDDTSRLPRVNEIVAPVSLVLSGCFPSDGGRGYVPGSGARLRFGAVANRCALPNAARGHVRRSARICGGSFKASFEATSGWSRKASEAELKGIAVCRD
jgi:hypothetical protein